MFLKDGFVALFKDVLGGKNGCNIFPQLSLARSDFRELLIHGAQGQAWSLPTQVLAGTRLLNELSQHPFEQQTGLSSQCCFPDPEEASFRPLWMKTLQPDENI